MSGNGSGSGASGASLDHRGPAMVEVIADPDLV